MPMKGNMMEKPKNLSATEETIFWEYATVFPDVAKLCEEISRLRGAMAMMSAGICRAAWPDAGEFLANRLEQPKPIEVATPAPIPVSSPSTVKSDIALLHEQYEACVPRSARTKYLLVNMTVYNIITKLGPQPYRPFRQWFLNRSWRKEYLTEAMTVLKLKRVKGLLTATQLPVPPVIDPATSFTGGKSQEAVALEALTIAMNSKAKGQPIHLGDVIQQLASNGIRLSIVYGAIGKLNGKRAKDHPERWFTFG
jgi:hypothetical protein